MTQRVKAPAIDLDDQSLIPRPHRVKRELIPAIVLWPPHKCHKEKEEKKKSYEPWANLNTQGSEIKKS